MFLVAHVNFLALKLSRIKSAVGLGRGREKRGEGGWVGGTGVFRRYRPCDTASQCGQQDYLPGKTCGARGSQLSS